MRKNAQNKAKKAKKGRFGLAEASFCLVHAESTAGIPSDHLPQDVLSRLRHLEDLSEALARAHGEGPRSKTEFEAAL